MNRRNHESHWIEDTEDHIYPKKRHLEELKVIGAQMVKEIKESSFWREVSTPKVNSQKLEFRK